MGVCKGNVGNIMQHWVLTEVLNRVHLQGKRWLHLVCTNSMAPASWPEQPGGQTRPRFEKVRLSLSPFSVTTYQRAWCAISPAGALLYPSSAAFAAFLWPGKLRLTLCETNPGAIGELTMWVNALQVQRRAPGSMVHPRDWRTLFNSGIPNLGEDVTLIEVDPYRFEHNGAVAFDPAALFPSDLATLTAPFAAQNRLVIFQISSYSANNKNPHTITQSAICDALNAAGFTLTGDVRANGDMISLVFTNGSVLWPNAVDANTEFHAWLNSV
ncbi:MAG: hypothetical protein E4H27_10355 [Anaerolineales bacterium]|nr:MAG: hypothetical protein E4H27_10355 [Anaerolineales bacterium]